MTVAVFVAIIRFLVLNHFYCMVKFSIM